MSNHVAVVYLATASDSNTDKHGHVRAVRLRLSSQVYPRRNKVDDLAVQLDIHYVAFYMEPVFLSLELSV